MQIANTEMKGERLIRDKDVLKRFVRRPHGLDYYDYGTFGISCKFSRQIVDFVVNAVPPQEVLAYRWSSR